MTLNRPHFTCVVIAIVAFMFVAQIEVAAQATFKRGDKVMASPSMLKDDKYYRQCTVIQFDRSANAYQLDCDGTEYVVPSTYVRAPKGTDAVEEEAQVEEPVGEKPKADVAAPPKEEDLPVTKRENKPTTTNKGDGKFKVGDRVLASPKMLKADKNYQPCTITSINPPNSYGMRCDPFNGISFEDYSVREDFVRPWKDATPAPTFDCSLEQPPAANIKTAAASAAVFKRIIYEWEATTYSKTKIGMTFETFQIGRAFKNVYVNSKNALLYEGFPQSATIYPVKTRFVRCVEGTDYNTRRVIEMEYACAKNRFGEWSCGAGGFRKESDLQYVPKK